MPAAATWSSDDDQLPVVVPEAASDRLQGATLDFVTDAVGRGRSGHREPEHAAGARR